MKKIFAHHFLLLILAVGTTPAMATPWFLYLYDIAPGPTGFQQLTTCNAATGQSCKGGSPDGNDPFANQSISDGVYTSDSYANLSTGQLGISGGGPTLNMSTARAQFSDTLTFQGIAPGDVTTIGITIQVNGTFLGGSIPNFYFNAFSPTYEERPVDQLAASVGYRGTFIGGNTPGGTYTTSSSNMNVFNMIGDWSQFGPSAFIGSIDIYGNAPTLWFDMMLDGSGVFDLSHTAAISLDLPEGLSFTSDSGVFLSAASPQPVPEPATLALLCFGLTGLGFTRVRTRAWRAANGSSVA